MTKKTPTKTPHPIVEISNIFDQLTREVEDYTKIPVAEETFEELSRKTSALFVIKEASDAISRLMMKYKSSVIEKAEKVTGKDNVTEELLNDFAGSDFEKKVDYLHQIEEAPTNPLTALLEILGG